MLNSRIALLILTLLTVLACTQNADQIKHQQYVLKGKSLYVRNCQNCHQQDGTGLGKLIPPLKGGHFTKDFAQAACIIKHGKQGILTIDSVIYKGKMPSNSELTPLEIANILTYISSEWGTKNFVSIDEVSSALKQCIAKD